MTAAADFMVEHVASYLKKDPVDVKFANLYKVGQPLYHGVEIPYLNMPDVYQSKRKRL